jgi:hypothetical protein
MTATQPEMRRGPVERVGSVRRKNRMDQVIETLASGLGNSFAWLAENGIPVRHLRPHLDRACGRVDLEPGKRRPSMGNDPRPAADRPGRRLAAPLPVMVGLWVWETTWPPSCGWWSLSASLAGTCGSSCPGRPKQSGHRVAVATPRPFQQYQPSRRGEPLIAALDRYAVGCNRASNTCRARHCSGFAQRQARRRDDWPAAVIRCRR